MSVELIVLYIGAGIIGICWIAFLILCIKWSVKWKQTMNDTEACDGVAKSILIKKKSHSLTLLELVFDHNDDTVRTGLLLTGKYLRMIRCPEELRLRYSEKNLWTATYEKNELRSMWTAMARLTAVFVLIAAALIFIH